MVVSVTFLHPPASSNRAIKMEKTKKKKPNKQTNKKSFFLLIAGTSAVSSSVGGVLDGDKTRMQRVSSVDSFNQVHCFYMQLASCVLRRY